MACEIRVMHCRRAALVGVLNATFMHRFRYSLFTAMEVSDDWSETRFGLYLVATLIDGSNL